MRVLVTGANGFVGREVVAELRRRGRAAIAGVRVLSDDAAASDDGVERRATGDLAAAPDLSGVLRGVDVVVHTAARVHMMHDTAASPAAEYQRANVDATRHVASQAIAAGVKRFVMVSSVKAMGERTSDGERWTSNTPPRPIDPYGVSKLTAENTLRDLERASGLEVVIVRPPLVYGPGVRANFATMMRWLVRGVPLPLAGIRNRRSLVALPNLANLLVTCALHAGAAGRTFLASDDDDLSTPQLLRRLSRALGCRPRLFPLPPAALRAVAGLAGKRDAATRLLDSLQLDVTATKEVLDWRPPTSVDDALAATARAFLEGRP